MHNWKTYLENHPSLLLQKSKSDSSFKTEKIIHIIIDGISKYFFEKNDFSNIKKLEKKGTSFKQCRTIWPSLTGPAHTAINSGTYPSSNKVCVNFYKDKKTNQIMVVNPLKQSRADSIAEILGMNGYSTAGICGQMNRGLQYFVSEAYIGHDAEKITDAALSTINEVAPDYLQVVYFTLDTIQHKYGPESREAAEAAIWLDEQIKRLLDSINQNNTTIIISADHGQAKSDLQAIDFDNLLEVNNAIVESHGRFCLFHTGSEKHDKDIAKQLMQFESVDRVISPSDILSCFKHDHAIVLKSGYFHSEIKDINYRWNHGGLSDEEMYVPLIFYGPDIQPNVFYNEVQVVDIAPTLCMLMNISCCETFQGRALEELFVSNPEKRK